ncbi:parallel beta helix pectate lyase-like protein [Ancylomarina subtilis]|uniref:Parallel beta helix pectate lyase-like protein n=1 Tax=Ancylomarina subtilis TaxID=1639035 RepID=A0A4Q7VKM6_9BACT|nr:right-handed parallel beta-helix repeat-containing protein [Ancylomarina subtilis]RZT96773.1 parallel beta helix pectate lyase-like protein [Ancylomarina subtilis]
MKNLVYLYFISAILFAACDQAISIEEEILTPPVEEVIPDPDENETETGTEVGEKDPITVMPYSQIPDKDYIIDLERWDIPNDGTDPVKTTDNLQAAIDWASAEGYGKIHLPAGHYLIGKLGNAVFQRGINLKSNMAFLLDKDAIIEMAPNDKWNYYVIEIKKQSNVVISGGTIIGDRDKHTYTPNKNGSVYHDGGHLIAIINESENVTVENVELSKATGDGILLQGYEGEGSFVKNIVIRKNNIFENRRQGVSIVGGVNVLIEENEIHHINGVAPQYGIDVESEIYFSEDIKILSNYFHHNKGGDIVNFDARKLLIEDNVLEEGEGNSYVGPGIVYYNNTEQIIRFNKIIHVATDAVNKDNGIIMYSNGEPKTNHDVTQIYENTCFNCGFYMYDGADLEIRDNTLTDGHLIFKNMTNLTLQNNVVTHPDKCRAMIFKGVAGSASGNTLNGESVLIPLNSEPIDGYGCDM